MPETLVFPLYGRAVESRKARAVLRDEKAVEIVQRLDYDFARFDGGPRLLGSVLRASILDAWTGEFLAEYPACCVVELGAGLSSRFERLDNGACRWYDLDLPEVIEVRRRFFAEGDRYGMLAGDLTDLSWMDTVGQLGGPHLFLAEGVLVYLAGSEVHRVLRAIASRFPGGRLGLDIWGRRTGLLAAPTGWTCPDPVGLASQGLRLRQSRTLAQTPRPARRQMSPYQRLLLTLAALLGVPGFADYRVNLYDLFPPGTS